MPRALTMVGPGQLPPPRVFLSPFDPLRSQTAMTGASLAILSLLAVLGGAAAAPVGPAYMPAYIVGGGLAAQGRYKSLVGISAKGRDPFCGGALISPTKVLSAAHCFNDGEADYTPEDFLRRRMVAVVGLHNLRNLTGHEQRLQIRAITLHPQKVHDTTQGFDIAVVHLSEAAQTNEHVRIAELLEDDANVDWSTTMCEQPGWGKMVGWTDTDTLRFMPLTVLPEDECKRRGVYNFNPSKFCGFSAVGTACVGDSGSPLYCWINGRMTVTGIVSYGRPMCPIDSPYVVYARVSTLVPWVRKVAVLVN